MFGLNQQIAENTMAFLSQQYNRLPDRVKQALSRLEVRIMRKSDRLVILVKTGEGDEDAARVGENLIDQIYTFASEYLRRSFRVKIHIYEEQKDRQAENL